MLKYLLGLFYNLFNKGISLFALIDYKSKVNRKAKVNRGVKIYDSFIDSYSYVGGGSDIVCTEIGKFCSIAHNCSIGLGNHSIKNISTSPLFTEIKNGTGSSWTKKNSTKKFHRVSIGNDVWIGTKVIIMGGVHIGDGAIIGAGSIVTKDIPAYAVAAGVPAKVIRYRFEETIIEKLLTMKWWNMPEEKLKKNIELFQTENFNLSDLKRFEN
jgi:acetyltransferase-like isoleucine patch superfamily enzyme